MSGYEIQNPRELVEKLTQWLGGIWPDTTGFEDALPEPQALRPLSRTPLFVVTCENGEYGVERATANIAIGLQLSSDGSTAGHDYSWACKKLRDYIDTLCVNLYKPSVGLFYGTLPGQLSWTIPVNQPRPVWQAQINITFELKKACRDNGDFLI